MKFKVGDYAQPKDGYAEECGVYNNNEASYIKITGIEADYLYNIYDDYGRYTTRCSICFDDDNLQPYTPTPEQLEAEIEEAVEEVEEPKQTKPQLTYKKEIIYTRSDGTVFREDEITYNGQFISVETLRLYSNLYKAWKGRKFDE
jgi:hypothetical protein